MRDAFELPREVVIQTKVTPENLIFRFGRVTDYSESTILTTLFPRHNRRPRYALQPKELGFIFPKSRTGALQAGD